MAEEEKQKEEKKAPSIDVEAFEAAQESIKKLEEKNRELIAKLGNTKSEAQKAAEEAARKSGDIEALEKSWKEKLESETKARDEQIASFQSTISQMTAGATASKMASDIAIPGSADVLMPHIERRLKTEMTDAGPIVRVLDKTGKPSAMSVDDLKKEISEDKAFAPLIVGSMANGSGQPGSKGQPQKNSIKRSAFDQLSHVDRAKHIKDGGIVVD